MAQERRGATIERIMSKLPKDATIDQVYRVCKDDVYLRFVTKPTLRDYALTIMNLLKLDQEELSKRAGQ